MIDSVRLVWGHAIGTAERRARGCAEPLSPPVRLDLDRLGERLGAADGQITTKTWGGGEPTPYGAWKSGNVELMYREGRLELRASLPKLLLGRNDVVLDERGVHDALVELVRVGRELVDGCGSRGHPSTPALTLREADPARLDYCFQWSVPSVAFTLEHMKAAFAPRRKLRTENVAPTGGRSVTWGYGSKRVIRFYDKVGELLARKEDVPADVELDTLLRYEIQDQRRGHLRLVHENGYRAADVRDELARGVQAVGAIALRDLDAIVATYGEWQHRYAYTLASVYVAEHDEVLPWLRKRVGSSTYARWKQRARVVAMTVGDFEPTIPIDAFAAAASPIWAREAA